MNEHECVDAVRKGLRVRLVTTHRTMQAEGRAVAYCDVPQIRVETDGGARTTPGRTKHERRR
jgi:hypothetical protein